MEQESKSMEMRTVVKWSPCPICRKRMTVGKGGPGNLIWYINCEGEDHTVSFQFEGTRSAAIAAWNKRPSDHAAAMKAAQDTIAVEKRALLAANAELAKDTERMRVMREALEKRDSEWIRSAGKFRKALNDAGLHGHYTLFQEWEWPAALANTAPVAATCSKPAAALVPRLGLSWACVLTKGHTGNCQPGGSCRAHGPYVGTPHCPHPVEECVRILMDRSSARVAEAGQKEGEQS